MMKITKLTLLVLLLSALTIIACQKQDSVQPSSTLTKTNSTSITLARTDAKNYRICLDTAAAITTAWRKKNEASFSNGVPNSFTISIQSLQQLLTEAATNHTNLSALRIYLTTTKDNKINIITVPVGMDNADILHYDSEPKTQFATIYQPSVAMPCPPTCELTSNVLNTSK